MQPKGGKGAGADALGEAELGVPTAVDRCEERGTACDKGYRLTLRCIHFSYILYTILINHENRSTTSAEAVSATPWTWKLHSTARGHLTIHAMLTACHDACPSPDAGHASDHDCMLAPRCRVRTGHSNSRKHATVARCAILHLQVQAVHTSAHLRTTLLCVIA